MTKTIKALVIGADFTMVEQDIDPVGDDLRELVGGWIECPPCGDNDLSFFINEEGKLQGLPINRLATEMWHITTPMMRGHDVLVGTVVITGGTDSRGNTLPLPQGWVRKFSEIIEVDMSEDGE